MRIPAAFLLVFWLSGSAVWATTGPAPNDSTILYKNCGKGANKWAESYCFRYITGVLEAKGYNGQQLGGRAVCPPRGITKGELVAAVKAWLRRHPEQRQTPADQLIARALADTWPCR